MRFRGRGPALTSERVAHARDGHLRRQLRPGRQAADCVAEDGRRKQVPADLDRPPRGGRDPDEAPGCLDAPPHDPRPARRRPRPARLRGRAHHGHRAAREHLLCLHHRAAERLRDRDRLSAVRRDCDRRPLRGPDLRRRAGDRGVGDRVRGRRRERGRDRRRVQEVPRRRLPRPVRGRRGRQQERQSRPAAALSSSDLRRSPRSSCGPATS
jgi:hypothetical protein